MMDDGLLNCKAVARHQQDLGFLEHQRLLRLSISRPVGIGAGCG